LLHSSPAKPEVLGVGDAHMKSGRRAARSYY
jgi:hypothetical protein